MAARRRGTIRVGAGDIQLGQLNVTHPMSPTTKDGAMNWLWWDATKRANLERVSVQVLAMHPIQRWQKPEDQTELQALIEQVPEVREVSDSLICYSSNGFVGTNGLCTGRSCETCPHAMANRCKRYEMAYVRMIDPADPLPRQTRFNWASGAAVTRIVCETELVELESYAKVFTLIPGERECRVGSAPMATISEIRDATDEEKEAAYEMLVRFVEGRVDAAMAAVDVPTVMELAAATAPHAIEAAPELGGGKADVADGIGLKPTVDEHELVDEPEDEPEREPSTPAPKSNGTRPRPRPQLIGGDEQ